MQQVVGGDIEIFYLEDDVVLVCNDEGKVKDLPLNRAVFDDHHRLVDVIAGDFFICSAPESSSHFASLSAEQMEKYRKTFEKPLRFIKTPDGLHAVTVNEKTPGQER